MDEQQHHAPARCSERSSVVPSADRCAWQGIAVVYQSLMKRLVLPDTGDRIWS